MADADTGHGGDAHVRNLIRRFVEAGVPGAEDVRGHLLFGLGAGEYRAARVWLERAGLLDSIRASGSALGADASPAAIDAALDELD